MDKYLHTQLYQLYILVVHFFNIKCHSANSDSLSSHSNSIFICQNPQSCFKLSLTHWLQKEKERERGDGVEEISYTMDNGYISPNPNYVKGFDPTQLSGCIMRAHHKGFSYLAAS